MEIFEVLSILKFTWKSLNHIVPGVVVLVAIDEDEQCPVVSTWGVGKLECSQDSSPLS